MSDTNISTEAPSTNPYATPIVAAELGSSSSHVTSSTLLSEINPVHSTSKRLATAFHHLQRIDDNYLFGFLLPTLTAIFKVAFYALVTYLCIQSRIVDFAGVWFANGLSAGYLLSSWCRKEFWILVVGMAAVHVPLQKAQNTWGAAAVYMLMNIAVPLANFLIIGRFANGLAWRDSWLYLNFKRSNSDAWERRNRKMGMTLALGNRTTALVIVLSTVVASFFKGLFGAMLLVKVVYKQPWDIYPRQLLRLFSAEWLGLILLIPFFIALGFQTSVQAPKPKTAPWKFTIALLCPLTIVLNELLTPSTVYANTGDPLPFLSYFLSFPIILCCGVIAGPVGFTFSTLCQGIAAVVSIMVIPTRPQDPAQLNFFLNIAAAKLSRLQFFLAVVVITSLVFIVMQEQKEKAYRELEMANREKSAFMAFLCHELRNPLHAIMNVGAFLKEESLARQNANDWPKHLKRGNISEGDALGMCDAICESSQYMADLINDVLDTSKFEAGKVQLENQLCNLSQVLNSVVLPVREHLRVRGVEFTLNAQFESQVAHGGLPALVEMDATRFKQVLSNLLSNAVKFTPEGGRVELSVKLDDRLSRRVRNKSATWGTFRNVSNVTFGSISRQQSDPQNSCGTFCFGFPWRPNVAPSDVSLEEIVVVESLPSAQQPSSTEPATTERIVNLLITLTDTGPGIPPDQMSSLFRPYHQAPTSYTTHTSLTSESKAGSEDSGYSTSKVGDMGGTGLGLSIVKQIVDLWGGDVGVESKLGSGSTFSVRLPVLVYSSELRGADGDVVSGMVEEKDGKKDVVGVDIVEPSSAEVQGLTTAMSVDTLSATLLEPSASMTNFHVTSPHSTLSVPSMQPAALPLPPSKPEESDSTAALARLPYSQVHPVLPAPQTTSTTLPIPQQKPPFTSDFADLWVLIVDDSSINRKILSKLMQLLGVTNIHESSNGLEALEAVTRTSLTLDKLSSIPPSSDLLQQLPSASSNQERHKSAISDKFDIIFMDIQMPVLDGVESTRFLRCWGCTIPIVAVTGNHISDKDGFLKHGFDALAPKPFLKVDAERLLRRFCLAEVKKEPLVM
ncbi:Histidine kinase [Chytridiales sp. JEL 0842]|nr:Histidine kinase [Chytridiales sp. JEL 0842]